MPIRRLLAVAVISVLTLPASAGAMTLERVGSVGFATSIAPGPGASVWTLGEELTLTDADGTVDTAWPVHLDAWASRLATDAQGNVWTDVDGKAALTRTSMDRTARTFALPINPWAQQVDDIDTSPSGVVWATATVPVDRKGTRAKSYAMRIDPRGRVRVSRPVASLASTDHPPTIAASDRGDAWMGTRCGRVRLVTRTHDLALASPPPRCGHDNANAPLSLRHSPDRALWEVLGDGRVRRTRAGRTVTLTRIGVGTKRVGLAFTGRGARARTWVQTAHRVDEIAPTGRTKGHLLARQRFPGEHGVEARGITADRVGGLWLITAGGLQRLHLDRCPIRRVTGLLVAEAVAVLRGSDCHVRLGVVHGGGSGTVRVTGQSLAAGTEVPAGTTVTLSLARTPVHCAVDPRRETLAARSGRWVVTSGTEQYHAVVRVCDRHTGHRWTVADSETEDGEVSYEPNVLSGNWLAMVRHYYSGISHEGDEESTTIVLVDLIHHRLRNVLEQGSSWWAGDDGHSGDDTSGTPFRKWALNDHGDVAWLEDHAVRLLPHGAKEARTLDATEGVAYAELKLDGRHVRWTRDGVAVSALI